MYEARTHGSVRGMMLDLIIQHHPTRLLTELIEGISVLAIFDDTFMQFSVTLPCNFQ